MNRMVSWDVALPQRSQRTESSPSLGSIRISSDGVDAKYIDVPVSVARHMAQKKRHGEISNPIELSSLMQSIHVSSEQAASQLVYKLLSRRDHSTYEVRKRLSSDGFDQDLVSQTVERFSENGILSDQRFADAFIRRKVASGRGLQRIEYELSQRGVDVHDLKGWPESFVSPDEEHSRAYKVALRKTVREPNAYAKMVRFLAGRGFSLSISKSVAKEVLYGT